MPTKSLRDRWKKAKASAASAFDLTKLVDKENFGGKLDKFEAARESYEKTMKKLSASPNDAKAKAAKAAVVAAAKTAGQAGSKYLVAIDFLEKSSTGATQQAANDLKTVLSMKILPTLSKAAKGDMTAWD